MSKSLTRQIDHPAITAHIRATKGYCVITEDEICASAPDFYPPSTPVIAWGYCKEVAELAPITVAGVITGNYAVLSPCAFASGRYGLTHWLDEENPTIAAWLLSVRRFLGIKAR